MTVRRITDASSGSGGILQKSDSLINFCWGQG